MFGLSFEKIVIAGIIAVIVIGPSRLPACAQMLGTVVRALRVQIDVARERAADSLGAENWQSLYPAHYDPRRIIREALDQPAPEDPGAARTTADPTGTGRASAEAGAGTSSPVLPDTPADSSSPTRPQVGWATRRGQPRRRRPSGDQSLKSKSSLSIPGNWSSYLIILSLWSTIFTVP